MCSQLSRHWDRYAPTWRGRFPARPGPLLAGILLGVVLALAASLSVKPASAHDPGLLGLDLNASVQVEAGNSDKNATESSDSSGDADSGGSNVGPANLADVTALATVVATVDGDQGPDSGGAGSTTGGSSTTTEPSSSNTGLNLIDTVSNVVANVTVGGDHDGDGNPGNSSDASAGTGGDDNAIVNVDADANVNANVLAPDSTDVIADACLNVTVIGSSTGCGTAAPSNVNTRDSAGNGTSVGDANDGAGKNTPVNTHVDVCANVTVLGSNAGCGAAMPSDQTADAGGSDGSLAAADANVCLNGAVLSSSVGCGAAAQPDNGTGNGNTGDKGSDDSGSPDGSLVNADADLYLNVAVLGSSTACSDAVPPGNGTGIDTGDNTGGNNGDNPDQSLLDSGVDVCLNVAVFGESNACGAKEPSVRGLVAVGSNVDLGEEADLGPSNSAVSVDGDACLNLVVLGDGTGCGSPGQPGGGSLSELSSAADLGGSANLGPNLTVLDMTGDVCLDLAAFGGSSVACGQHTGDNTGGNNGGDTGGGTGGDNGGGNTGGVIPGRGGAAGDIAVGGTTGATTPTTNPPAAGLPSTVIPGIGAPGGGVSAGGTSSSGSGGGIAGVERAVGGSASGVAVVGIPVAFTPPPVTESAVATSAPFPGATGLPSVLPKTGHPVVQPGASGWSMLALMFAGVLSLLAGLALRRREVPGS